MPDVTVSADVDSMLRSANDAAIRSAIGVGTTDAPTFLAQSLTGQSLTGTQATSLVDLSTTWLSTTGTPTAIKLNVTDTASNAASLLMDLQVGGASYFRVQKDGATTWRMNAGGTSSVALYAGNTPGAHVVQSTGLKSILTPLSLTFNTNNSPSNPAILTADGADILAQRNARVPQAFRVYNDYVDVNNYERAVFDYKSSLGDLIIGHEALGSGMVANRTIKFKTAGFFPLQLDTSNATFGVNILTSGFCTWLVPVSATTGAQNRSIAFELASNTALTIKVRGTDGVVRSAALILA